MIDLFFRFRLRLLPHSCFHQIVNDGTISPISQWKHSDSCDSDSVELKIPLFGFYQVLSAITTPLTTQTPLLVKTSLCCGVGLTAHAVNKIRPNHFSSQFTLLQAIKCHKCLTRKLWMNGKYLYKIMCQANIANSCSRHTVPFV